MLSLAEWVDCAPGEIIVEKGKRVSNVLIMISGQVEAVVNDKLNALFRPGQLIGTAEVFGGLGSSFDAVVREPARLVKWNIEGVSEFAASRPELRAKLSAIVSADLAGKQRQAADIISQTR